jgi:hypothetical protein
VFLLLQLSLRFQKHLSYKEFTIAQLADFTSWFLTVSIKTRFRVEASLIAAIFAVRISAELAEDHLLLVCESYNFTRPTFTQFPCFFFGTSLHENLLFVVQHVVLSSNAELVHLHQSELVLKSVLLSLLLHGLVSLEQSFIFGFVHHTLFLIIW